MTDDLLEEAREVLSGRTIAVLTGAGVSTDSGIPDYRGEGAPVRTPMSVQQFLGDPDYRKRYWAGSHLGWEHFSSVKPNEGHFALVRLERSGIVNGVITQNVDGLHRRAGSQRVVELHGSMDSVRCLQCLQMYSRGDIAQRLAAANPWLEHVEPSALRPDGDVEVKELEGFTVPTCTVCGGTLKPDVVYFGELIPRERFAQAASLLRQADALLIAGSSLMVNSGIRLLDQAVKAGYPTVIVNRGPTKGDVRATVKLEAGASETLSALADSLTSNALTGNALTGNADIPKDVSPR